MPLNFSDKKINFLVGGNSNGKSCEVLHGQEPSFSSALPPFDEKVIEFLNDLSKALMPCREYSDVVTFAFWIRKGNINSLKKRFFIKDNNGEDDGEDSSEGRELCLGRGIVFHIAPSNVPVNFAYSLVTALLCGNSNIVRVPTKEFPQVKIITEAINTVLAKHTDMVGRIVCVRYDHDKEINDFFSSICDVRIIWGGDRTIEEIRKSPLPARSTEITFADRYSLAVIDSDAYLAMVDAEKERTAVDFYNDTFFSDQNACTSPRVVIWTGKSSEGIEKAKSLFWELEHKLVKERYNFQAIQGMNKLTKAYLFAAEHAEQIKRGSDQVNTQGQGIRIEPHEDNLIIRVSVPEITSDLMNYQDNSGYFYEYDCKEPDLLELKPICDDKRCQTIGYIGNKEMFQPLLTSGIKGVDRIVPIGKTMDFDLAWDGYNLPKHLSRVIANSTITSSAPKIVKSLVDFLNILQEQKSERLTVYRGHSNKNYEIKPSLFRKGNESFRERENEILKEVEAARPDAFSPNMTTLEKLVLLQHYQMPTRLLDVTLNPLVALYFTVCSSKDKDGEVLVFNVDPSITKTFDSDTVACFANLAQLNNADKQHIKKMLNTNAHKIINIKNVLDKLDDRAVRKIIEENYNQLVNIFLGIDGLQWDLTLDFISDLVQMSLPANYSEIGYDTPEDYISGFLDVKDLTELVSEGRNNYISNVLDDDRQQFNNDGVVRHFVHFIRSEKPFFENIIDPLDLRKVLYVKAKQSNPRIVAQNGAFFILGMGEGINENWPMRIKIDANSKEKIKRELNSIGINEHTLFPEFEYFIKDVKERFNRTFVR